MSTEEPSTGRPAAGAIGRYPAIITRHADAVALLNDPAYTVISEPVRELEQSKGGVAWLRANVSRFATGEVHSRRRALVDERLARLDPDDLRRRAFELSRVDSSYPLSPGALCVTVLARALGVHGEVAPLVAAIAPAYFPGSAVDPGADAAVDDLVRILGGHYDEQAAATICVLIQAHDATAGLATFALAAAAANRSLHSGHEAVLVEAVPVEALLVEVLRHDPPVAALRRMGPEGPVAVDVRAANRDPAVFADPDRFDPHRPDALAHLTFGAGARPCPGAAHALAIAAGIVSATLDRPA
jgi:cytochrome P450